MITEPSRQFRRRSAPGGFSLLEVIVVVGMVSACLAALFVAMMSSIKSTRESGERMAAMRAARAKLETISRMAMVDLITAYGEATPLSSREFQVELEINNSLPIYLQGINGRAAGEVVVIQRENGTSTGYGRDLNGDGQPDGVQFRGFPVDLNGDNDTADGFLGAGSLAHVPVGVIVRWPSGDGREERFELWTTVSQW
jgi:type II secretory pathway pseudopilin PulG